MCTNSWEGSGSLECVMERWEETHDLSELLLLRRIFHSFCFFTETKRNHTNHRRLKCQGLQRVPCSLFGRRFFFFCTNVVLSTQPLFAAWIMCFYADLWMQKVPSICIFMTVAHHKLLLDWFDLIFCLIFVFTHANNQHLKIKFVHVSKYI